MLLAIASFSNGGTTGINSKAGWTIIGDGSATLVNNSGTDKDYLKLVDILKEIGSTKAQIRGVNTKVTKEKIAIIDMTLEVENLEELNKAIKVIRKVDSVYEVKRKK